MSAQALGYTYFRLSAQAFRTKHTHFPLYVGAGRLWGIHTFACRHRLLERSIHTFLCMSAQTLGYTYFRLSAQAFRTKHTHFPLYVGAGSGVYILSLVGTSFQNEAYTLSFVCRRRLWGIHTFACRHKLSERSIHTFLCMSAQALGYTYFRLSAQAFRTKHTHFPLYVGAGSGVYILSLVGTSFQNEAYTLSFVCRRRLWGIHTFACRHKLSERSIHTFLCMSAQALGYTYFRLSAQAFRTKHTHFPLYVGAGSRVYILSLVGTSFQNEAYTLSFVCRRRLWGIHTFACRHKLSERSIHTFLCMSAQALGYTYFSLVGTGF